ncbi:MAG TPA: nucleotide exchange factor GrpE [Acidobacteriaceae bacterium]|jgi:molecular chaperone GrpE
MNRVRNAFARWSRMGNNKEETGMSEQDTMQENEAQTETAQAEVEAGTEGGNLSEVEQLVQERDALKDRLARLQAEFDNARKREIKERQDARDYATQNAVEPFLGVMDNFQLALKAEGSVEQLRSGVELILKQMDEALRGLQVQPVEAVGAQFDPRVHEALGSIETVEHPDHQVLEEIRRGYKLRDKLLRPALVRIASNPAQVNE